MTRQFLMERRLSGINWRYDVLAIEARAGKRQSCACTKAPLLINRSQACRPPFEGCCTSR
jgi:hypothetical protein